MARYWWKTNHLRLRGRHWRGARGMTLVWLRGAASFSRGAKMISDRIGRGSVVKARGWLFSRLIMDYVVKCFPNHNTSHFNRKFNRKHVSKSRFAAWSQISKATQSLRSKGLTCSHHNPPPRTSAPRAVMTAAAPLTRMTRIILKFGDRFVVNIWHMSPCKTCTLLPELPCVHAANALERKSPLNLISSSNRLCRVCTHRTVMVTKAVLQYT